MHWMRHRRVSPREAAGEDRKGGSSAYCAVLYYSVDGGSTVNVTSGLRSQIDVPEAEVFAVDDTGKRIVRIHDPPPS